MRALGFVGPGVAMAWLSKWVSLTPSCPACPQDWYRSGSSVVCEPERNW
jgi:hypothetical protein